MPREFTQEAFFDHSSYNNVLYAAQIPLEYYLADTLMRSDLSRVQWSSNEYAFRRRFELADAQNGGEFSNLQPSSLKLPFVNYWYENGKFWEPDDRPFSVNSQQILKGQWEEGMPSRLYSIAVKTPLIATVYYATDKDARLAYELLMWERQPKGPVQLTSSITWKGVDVQVPAFVTIDDVNFNPKFNETDWLKSQRMFPLQLRMTLRTYIIYFPHQSSLVPEVAALNRKMPPYSTGARGDGGDETAYITEQVLLNFAAMKQWGSVDIGEPFTITGTQSEDYAQQAVDIDSTDGLDTYQYTTDSINDTTIDIVTGYFTPTTDLNINAVSVDPETITTTSFILTWDINPADLENFKDVTIMVPGQAPIRITDPTVTSQLISGVYPNSTYDVVVLFHSLSGGVRDFHLSVTTASDPTNPVPHKNRRGKLRGMTW